MVATSGAELADAETIAAFESLMDIATVVTPNLDELTRLGGEDAVLRRGCALLVKGGHGDGDILTDRLLVPKGLSKDCIAEWEAPRIDTPPNHGTGCTLASAIDRKSTRLNSSH